MTNQHTVDNVRQPNYLLRGAMMGLALLPTYFAFTLSVPSSNQVFPMVAGMAILGILGAAVGYILGNLTGFFDFSRPEGFLALPKGGTTRPHAKQEDIDSFDWDLLCPFDPLSQENLDSFYSVLRFPDDPFEPRRWDDNENRMRGIFSGDWRDEYSSSSSREEDDRRDGLI